MESLGSLAGIFILFLSGVLILAILMPFFVLRIRNEIISMNKTMEKNLSVQSAINSNLKKILLAIEKPPEKGSSIEKPPEKNLQSENPYFLQKTEKSQPSRFCEKCSARFRNLDERCPVCGGNAMYETASR